MTRMPAFQSRLPLTLSVRPSPPPRPFPCSPFLSHHAGQDRSLQDGLSPRCRHRVRVEEVGTTVHFEHEGQREVVRGGKERKGGGRASIPRTRQAREGGGRGGIALSLTFRLVTESHGTGGSRSGNGAKRRRRRVNEDIQAERSPVDFALAGEAKFAQDFHHFQLHGTGDDVVPEEKRRR